MFSSFFFHPTVQIFCEEQRSQLKAENPKAGAAELSKLLSQAWRELSVVDKTPYLEQSKEMKAAAAAAAAASTAASLGEDEDGEEAEPSKRKRPAAPRSAAGKKRAKRSAAEDDDGDVAVNDADQQEDDDDIDREVRNLTNTIYIIFLELSLHPQFRGCY